MISIPIPIGKYKIFADWLPLLLYLTSCTATKSMLCFANVYATVFGKCAL
jgi:hypothetical protein